MVPVLPRPLIIMVDQIRTKCRRRFKVTTIARHEVTTMRHNAGEIFVAEGYFSFKRLISSIFPDFCFHYMQDIKTKLFKADVDQLGQ